jgi:hypothetical protein
MKTRTLMLLALGCGVAIMLAGAALFIQLARQDDIAEPVPVGDVAIVGDMSVTVESAVERGGRLTVSVRIGGVDDPDGGRDFRLIASARPLLPDGASGSECVSTSVEPHVCEVTFDVSGADGSSRVLFYERGEEQARWVLS